MKATQYQRLERLLTRKKGATAMDIVQAIGTTCPHKRVSDLRQRGWTILWVRKEGTTHGVYKGTPPGQEMVF